MLERYLSNESSDEESLEMISFLETPEGEELLDSYLHENFENNPSLLSPDMSEKESFKKLAAASELSADDKAAVIRISPLKKPWYFKFIAAAACFAALAGIFFYFNKDNLHRIKTSTNAGDRKNIRLPDGSEVILYENSTLSYNDNFTDNNRNVYLNGEAFFKVKHTAEHTAFTVHTKDSMHIRVLGTKFEVSDLNGKSRVILEEGKVMVNLPDSVHTDHAVLQPGDMLTVNEVTKKAENKKVNAILYTGRSGRSFELNNTPFAEISSMLKEIYGYETVLPDDQTARQAFSGTLPNNSLDDILKGLSKIVGLNYSVKGKKIIFY